MFIHKSRRIYILVHPTKSRESYKVYALSIFVRKFFEPGIGTWSFRFRGTGCRGIARTAPPPLLMECCAPEEIASGRSTNFCGTHLEPMPGAPEVVGEIVAGQR